MFKGIWIPTELIEIDISWTKRILIAEITQLEMLDKGCIASNSHFADKLKISKQAVSKALNELSKDGMITIDNAQTKRNFGRTITINFSKSGVHESKSAINFSKSGVHESGESKENKQSNKSISNSVNSISLIITHLNDTLGTSYKTSSKKTLDLINARLNDGFTLEDFKRVHIIKSAEWNGSEMQKYLRPSTLYGTKFEQYLNQQMSNNEKLKAVTNHTGTSAFSLLAQEQ